VVNARVEVLSLKTGVTKTLVNEAYFGRYVPANATSGYLVYLHPGGVLYGVAFNPARLQVQGSPVPLLDDVNASSLLGGGQFDFSAAGSGHGTLVYLAGKAVPQSWRVMWLDTSGKMKPLIAASGAYTVPRFSPDGKRLALAATTSTGNDLYVYDLGRETMTRLTFGGHAYGPVWTPDGKHIAFASFPSNLGIWWVRSDGAGEPQRILESQDSAIPWSFAPDGRRLAYQHFNRETLGDLWTMPLETTDPDHPRPGKPEPFLVTPANELNPAFSPDGHWMAYRSNDAGINEVYVQPSPGSSGGQGGKWQVSAGGGENPLWSNNRRELFYETEDYHIMVVDYKENGGSFIAGKPRLWSDKQMLFSGSANIALAPDGKRFAVLAVPEATGAEQGSVHVVFLQNFLDELRRRVPAPK
jgi:dipeptidyl aminopeptidase/acylaminoacyl peptidase